MLRLAVDLGNIYLLTGEKSCNSTLFGKYVLWVMRLIVFRIMPFGDTTIPKSVTVARVRKAMDKLLELRDALRNCKLKREDGEVIIREFTLAIDMQARSGNIWIILAALCSISRD